MTEYGEQPDPDDLMAESMANMKPRTTQPPPEPPRAGSSAPIGGQVINWRTLPPADAPRAWGELRAWVEWFTVRYRISESVVPTCWWKHGQLVEELSALHAAHIAAFDRTDTGFGPIGWHERLSLALPRINRAYSGGCARGHDPLKPRSWVSVTDEQEWDAWTTRAHAHETPPVSPNRKEEG